VHSSQPSVSVTIGIFFLIKMHFAVFSEIFFKLPKFGCCLVFVYGGEGVSLFSDFPSSGKYLSSSHYIMISHHTIVNSLKFSK